MPRPRGLPFAIALLLMLAPPLAAQAAKDVPGREAEVDQKVVQLLVAFGRTAESYKAPSRARAVYEQILDHYDIDNATARVGLGYRRVKQQWQGTPPAQRPSDTATAAQLQHVTEAWLPTVKRVARLHRELGLALLAEGVETRGHFQLERSLAFEPEDVATHKALGHEELDGFYGTAGQLAFIRRMRDITAKARELAAQEFESTALPPTSMPRELRQSGLPFVGARSKNFTHWVIDSPEAAAASVTWAERAALLLDYLLPPDDKPTLDLRTIQWLAILRSPEEREVLFAASPIVLGKYTVAEARLFGGHFFKTATGWAEYDRCAEEHDGDNAVAHVTMRCCVRRGNCGLGEGLVHAMTWLLCGSTYSWYCDLPHTVSGGGKPLSHDPDQWLTRLFGEIAAGEDWPLVQVPRERYDNFRDSARVKSWSFMLWLIARYPDHWMKLFTALATEKLQTEDVDAAFEKVLDRKVGDVEAEWRDWARAGSRLGAASGLGR